MAYYTPICAFMEQFEPICHSLKVVHLATYRDVNHWLSTRSERMGAGTRTRDPRFRKPKKAYLSTTCAISGVLVAFFIGYIFYCLQVCANEEAKTETTKGTKR